MKTLFLMLLLTSAHAGPPDHLLCGNEDVRLQASGLRTATIFKLKIYVLSIYAKTANFSNRPSCYEITYLRDFDADDVDKAWDFQFKESADFTYPELKADLKKLKSFFGDIKNEGKHLFELTEETTKIYENGQLRGEISGKDFQKSFLSIWTGKNPPTKELQESIFKTMPKS